jgi:hypothetical protein
MNSKHLQSLALALAIWGAAGIAHAEDAKPAGIAEYTCWALMTEPEEEQGIVEVFYLGYALGRSGTEFRDEATYKHVVTTVLNRCKNEPDTKVVDAFADAIKAG